MITAAAICPCPPLLARELTGQAEVLPELRAACGAAVARLVADAPDLIVVTGPARETGSWPADGRLDVAAYAPALDRTGRPVGDVAYPASGAGAGAGASGAGASAGRALPLSLGMGARLLDEAGYAGPRAFRAIAELAPQDDCTRLGREIAASAPRVALLAMGDGSARRSVAAPGYLDERAAPFDSAVERAVRDGDLAALAALDKDLAGELLAGGRPAWQVLAGAVADGDPASAGGRQETKILYSDAPFGVGYLVAVLVPGQHESG
jgi:hypothetical protein